MYDQAVVPGVALQIALLVQNYLLLVLKLGNLFLRFDLLLQQGFFLVHDGITSFCQGTS